MTSVQLLGARLGRAWAMRRSRMAQHLVWSAFGQVVVAATGLLGVRILTELAPPDVYGTANLFITALTLGINMLVGPVSNTQARYHSEFAAEGKASGFSGEVLRLSFLGSIGVAVGAALLYIASAWAGGGPIGLWLALILLAWPPIYAVRNFLLTRILAERRQALQAIWQAVEAIAILAFTAALLATAATTERFLLGNLMAAGTVALVFLAASPFERDISLSGLSGGERRRVVALLRAYGFPFALLTVLSWLANLSERYVAAAALGVAAVGVYAAAFGIASRAQLIVGTMAINAFRPALFEAESRKDSHHARMIFRVWILVTGLASLAAILFFALLAPFITELLLAETYRPGAAAVMVVVAVGYGLQNMNQVVESRIMSLGNSTRLLWPMMVGATANLSLALAVIPAVGLVGAAIASASSFFLQLLSTSWALHRLRARRAVVEAPPLAPIGEV